MACSTFKVSPRLSVLCFKREGSDDPYFVVREFDTKVIRSPSQHKKGRGPSEQAIRASIRQAILNMSLKSERASKIEIRQLKAQGILGKRAPSCSLLCADDMLRLLEAFGKHACARELRIALKKDTNFSPLPMRAEEVRPRKRRHRSTAQSSKRNRVNPDTARLDALLCALRASEMSTFDNDGKSKYESKFKYEPAPEIKQAAYDLTRTRAEPVSGGENDDRGYTYDQSSSSRSPSRSPSPPLYQKTPEDDHIEAADYRLSFQNSRAPFAYTGGYVPPSKPNSEIFPSSRVLQLPAGLHA